MSSNNVNTVELLVFVSAVRVFVGSALIISISIASRDYTFDGVLLWTFSKRLGQARNQGGIWGICPPSEIFKTLPLFALMKLYNVRYCWTVQIAETFKLIRESLI